MERREDIFEMEYKAALWSEGDAVGVRLYEDAMWHSSYSSRLWMLGILPPALSVSSAGVPLEA